MRRPEAGGDREITRHHTSSQGPSPGIRAARDRVEAARAAVGPAGALPDPMLAVGITNLPVSDPGFSDFMTMKMVGIGQTLPYPGKLALRRRAATAEIGAADADLAAARLKVEAEVKQAYYELAFYDQALAIPASAARDEGGRRYAYVIAEGKVQRRELQLGDQDSEGRVYVLSGLQAGDVIVRNNLGRLREGATARVLEQRATR